MNPMVVKGHELQAGDRLHDGRRLERLMYDGAGDVWQTDGKSFKPWPGMTCLIERPDHPVEQCDGMGV